MEDGPWKSHGRREDAVTTTDVLAAARDEVRAALAADDVVSELRRIAIEIASRGIGWSGMEAVFASVCEELTEAGRDEESALVAYVLDMAEEWR
jgi:hypothetical protein